MLSAVNRLCITLTNRIPTLSNGLSVILSIMYIRIVTVNLRYVTAGRPFNMRSYMHYYGDI